MATSPNIDSITSALAVRGSTFMSAKLFDLFGVRFKPAIRASPAS